METRLGRTPGRPTRGFMWETRYPWAAASARSSAVDTLHLPEERRFAHSRRHCHPSSITKRMTAKRSTECRIAIAARGAIGTFAATPRLSEPAASNQDP
jgi:hypothetical protein